MDYLLSADGSLLGLFVSSFLAATLLPGGSEAVLFAVVRLHPEQTATALMLATVGNTLGGMSTYLLARLLPQKELPARLAAVKRYGAASLALAWAPLVGDALCAAAGWLRLNWLACMLWMALGKFARYVVVVAGAGMF
ncbi:MAG: DedA family protein [Betaproteobacteria bacterium]|nr:DedA family protein [Betaproteobacteria bacterium]